MDVTFGAKVADTKGHTKIKCRFFSAAELEKEGAAKDCRDALKRYQEAKAVLELFSSTKFDTTTKKP